MTEIDAATWAGLMNGARFVASLRGERVKIKAGIAGDRERRRTGKKYHYVIMNDQTGEALSVDAMERSRAALKSKWEWL